jgi:ribonuclease HI
MQGRYKVRNAELKKYYQRAVKMFLAIPEAKLEFVPREENRNADLLANQAIRTHLKSQLEKE